MTNYIQDGKIMEYSNSGSAISSGDVVPLEDRIGIAITDIAATTGKGSLYLEGVFELAKKDGEALSQGDQLYWDADPGELTKTASDGVYAGVCVKSELSGATTARVRLQPHPKRADHVADASAGSAAEINALRDAMIEAGIMKPS